MVTHAQLEDWEYFGERPRTEDEPQTPFERANCEFVHHVERKVLSAFYSTGQPGFEER